MSQSDSDGPGDSTADDDDICQIAATTAVSKGLERCGPGDDAEAALADAIEEAENVDPEGVAEELGVLDEADGDADADDSDDGAEEGDDEGDTGLDDDPLEDVADDLLAGDEEEGDEPEGDADDSEETDDETETEADDDQDTDSDGEST